MSMRTVMIIIVNSDVDDEPEHDCPLVLLNHLLKAVLSPKPCILYINTFRIQYEILPKHRGQGRKKMTVMMF